MRIYVDLSDEMTLALDDLAEASEISRAELVQKAVNEFLAKHQALAAAAGLWKARSEEGVAYQKRLRSEWER
jgi:predicted transcriptional regulator